VDVSGGRSIFFVALVPAKATAAKSHKEFYHYAGRSIGACTPEVPHRHIVAGLPSTLSYKVAGAALEDSPQAVLMIGVLRGAADAKEDIEFNFGAQLDLRKSGEGFVESGGAVEAT